MSSVRLLCVEMLDVDERDHVPTRFARDTLPEMPLPVSGDLADDCGDIISGVFYPEKGCSEVCVPIIAAPTVLKLGEN